jgi:2-polyprenyl-3-methyl-5-hydroxy-6-metoxy-1,4-benzoquinol methylase
MTFTGEAPMSREVDPEQNEIRELEQAASWADRDVLEIGCGDGRIARRAAGLGASVTAIEPDVKLVRSAMVKALESPSERTRYAVAEGQRLPFPGETFDTVVFGWSL